MPLPAYSSTFTYTIAADLKSVRIVGATPPPAGYQKIYLVGAITSGGWAFNTTNELNTEDGNLYYRKNMNLNSNTEFKVAGSGYNPNYGGVASIALNTTVTLQKSDNPSNCKYTGAKTSGLTVSFNLTTGEFLISDDGSMVGDGTDKNPYEGWYFNLRGEYNGWADNGVMPNAEGIATQTELAIGTGNFDVKVYDGSNDIYYYNNGTPIPTNQWVTLTETTEADKDCTVAGATAGSVYNVKFNVAKGEIFIEPTVINYPEDFYVIGNVNGGSFNPTNGVKMTTGENGVYTVENLMISDEASGYGYFSFCTQLGENDNDWNGLGTRYEATEKDAIPSLEAPNPIQVAQGNDNAFKIVSNKAYNITVDLATMTMDITLASEEEELTAVYLIGNVNDWDLTTGDLELDNEGDGFFAIYDVTLPSGNEGNSYFSFISKLATQTGDEGWAEIASYRFGAVDANMGSDYKPEFVNGAAELDYAYPSSTSWCVPAGVYSLILDTDAMILSIEGDATTVGVTGITSDTNAKAVYYNLQGVKVTNPENGVFIRVKGDKIVKVVK